MDLMDMNAPGGFPSLENLSQIAAPRMAPMGPSPIHAMFYGQDMARQRDLIQQATILSQLGQRIKEMQAGEYEAGHSGRMSKIRTQSALAQDDENALPTTLETREQERQNKASKSRSDALQGALKEIEPYVNAYDAAETADAKLAIKQEMADEGVTFGKHKVKLGELSDGDFDVFMKNARSKIANTPKDDLVRDTLHSKEKIAANNNAARMSLQGRKEALAMKLKQMGIDNQAAHEQELNRLARKASSEGLTPQEQEIFDTLLLSKAYPSIVRGDTDKGNLELDKNGNPVRNRPNITPPPRTPPLAKRSKSGFKSADDVKAAVESGTIDRETGIKILREEFGFK